MPGLVKIGMTAQEDIDKRIGEGTHVRYIVNKEKFMAKLK